MKIIITGNMGYVGPGVVRRLRKTYPGAELVGADCGFFAHCLSGPAVLPETLLDRQYFCDVRRLPDEVLRDADAIVYLAAISNDPMGKIFEKATIDINCKAAVELAAKAKAAGTASFVFASSCSVYGFSEGYARDEKSEVNPLTAYAISKVLAEKELESLADRNFKVTCLRFATACGISERFRLDLVLNDFVASAVASGAINILSDGTPWRPLINVKDMATAIDWAIIRDAADGGAFLAINTGSDEWNYQVRELAYAVSEVFPGLEIYINKDAQQDKRSYRVDFGLYRRLAKGYQPQYNLDTTIRGLKDGLLKLGFKDKAFRQSDFIRLNVLNNLRSEGLINESLEWAYRERC